MKLLKSGRVLLDENALTSLNKMFRALKEEGSHLKLNASSLVSSVVSKYEEKYFEKDKLELAESFLDRKNHIKFLIDSDAPAEEIVAAIKKFETLKKLEKKRAKNNPEALKTSENLSGETSV